MKELRGNVRVDLQRRCIAFQTSLRLFEVRKDGISMSPEKMFNWWISSFDRRSCKAKRAAPPDTSRFVSTWQGNLLLHSCFFLLNSNEIRRNCILMRWIDFSCLSTRSKLGWRPVAEIFMALPFRNSGMRSYNPNMEKTMSDKSQYQWKAVRGEKMSRSLDVFNVRLCCKWKHRFCADCTKWLEKKIFMLNFCQRTDFHWTLLIGSTNMVEWFIDLLRLSRDSKPEMTFNSA